MVILDRLGNDIDVGDTIEYKDSKGVLTQAKVIKIVKRFSDGYPLNMKTVTKIHTDFSCLSRLDKIRIVKKAGPPAQPRPEIAISSEDGSGAIT